ncbi:E3 ubiquitin-protein ligase RNF26-like [Phyllostomus hastatus]|uniref:E3 ubiquitin-protein ligase RNF26-like n=1 Tax=Phyllostomus hastatus TaxID=9423 RepID=UPI001E681C9C|nr:E3 ubiquitin-protein ligase RNF26-like [Phyllostomus hastatus]
MSLVACVISSPVNICLFGTQNLFSLLLSLWGAGMRPPWRMPDIMATFLAHISSSAEVIAIFLVALPTSTGTPGLTSPPLAQLCARLPPVLLTCVLAVTGLHLDLTMKLAIWALSQRYSQPSYHQLWEDVVQLFPLPLDLEAWY